MARGWRDLNVIVEPMLLPAHKVRAPRLDDWQYALPKGTELDRRGLRIEVSFVEVVDIRFREDISGVGKRWDPFAAPKLRVPANMIVMEMRAHHEIDLLGPRAGGGEPLKIRGLEHAPPRPRRAHSVVAAAGVDQDFLFADLQQPAVYAQFDFAARRIVWIGRKPMRVLAMQFIAEVWKELFRIIDRLIGLLDPRD